MDLITHELFTTYCGLHKNLNRFSGRSCPAAMQRECFVKWSRMPRRRNHGFWLSTDAGRNTRQRQQRHYFPLTRCRIESRPVGRHRRFYYRSAVILRRAHLPASVGSWPLDHPTAIRLSDGRGQMHTDRRGRTYVHVFFHCCRRDVDEAECRRARLPWVTMTTTPTTYATDAVRLLCSLRRFRTEPWITLVIAISLLLAAVHRRKSQKGRRFVSPRTWSKGALTQTIPWILPYLTIYLSGIWCRSGYGSWFSRNGEFQRQRSATAWKLKT